MKLIKTTTMSILFSGLLLCVTASANNEQGKVTSEEIECIYATITATSTDSTDSLDRVNKAIEICLKPAEAGSLKAQEALVNLYLDINLKESLKWTRKAVDNGSVQAQRALGMFYLDGLGGVKKDRQQAKKWLTKACNNNEQGACDLLKEYNLN